MTLDLQRLPLPVENSLAESIWFAQARREASTQAQRDSGVDAGGGGAAIPAGAFRFSPRHGGTPERSFRDAEAASAPAAVYRELTTAVKGLYQSLDMRDHLLCGCKALPKTGQSIDRVWRGGTAVPIDRANRTSHPGALSHEPGCERRRRRPAAKAATSQPEFRTLPARRRTFPP